MNSANDPSDNKKFNQQAWLLRFDDEKERERAFKELIIEFQQRLYIHLKRMLGNHDDADDALQTTFIKAWKGLHTFRAESKLYTWLYRIASNEALNIIKKRRGENALSMDDDTQTLPEPVSSENNLDSQKVLRWLDEAVSALPPKQQLVFNLKYFEGLKFEEMAEVTATSVGSLKASYHHAVKKIEVFIRSKAI